MPHRVLFALAALLLQPAVNADDIFVELWKIDQQHNGLSVTTRGDDGRWIDDTADLRLDEGAMNLDPREDRAPGPLLILHNAEKTKRPTYETITALFDNYVPDETKPEDKLGANPEEDAELESFLTAIMDTAVIQRTLDYINATDAHGQKTDLTREQFQQLVKYQWFQMYTNYYSSPKPDNCGFEHVIVGDHNGDKIGGHHFWWKFYLDQQAGTADSLGHKYRGPKGEAYPLLATFRMKWNPEKGVVLTNPEQKGFFVGCSPELMIAYGTLGLLYEKQNEGRHAVVDLEGGRFEIVVHTNTLQGNQPPDQRRGDQIKTFYPKLRQVAGTDQGAEVNVAAALNMEIGTRLQVSGVITDAHNNEFGMKLSSGENATEFLAVKLASAFRPEFNPLKNPNAIGLTVKVTGRRGKYTGVPGIVDVTNIEVIQTRP